MTIELSKIEITENPLVIALLEERVKMEKIKADFMQEFSKKMKKIEKKMKRKNKESQRLLKECEEFELNRNIDLEEYLEILAQVHNTAVKNTL